MKKLFVAAVFLLSVYASAQARTVLVAGSFGYESNTFKSNGEELKSDSYNISPKIGYQFTDNVTLGLESTIANTTNESNTIDNSSFSIGGFYRYSNSFSDTFSVYADLGVGYLSEKYVTEFAFPADSDLNGDGFYAALTPAMFINFNNYFGLNFSIGGLGYRKVNYDDDSQVSRFNVNFGQTLNIGVSKNF